MSSKSSWHISPLVDACAYHFSWVWALVPMLWLGGVGYSNSTFVFVFVITITFLHRHLSLPYAYLDPDARRENSSKLIVATALLLLFFASTLFAGAHSLMRSVIFPGAVFVAAAWNVWHTLMQKFGILRLYNAKQSIKGERGIPAWVDRLFVLSWVPFLAVYLVTHYRDTIARVARSYSVSALPAVDVVASVKFILLPLSLALVVAGMITFAFHEFKVNRFSNKARLSMACGLLGNFLAIVIFDPVKAYIAFGFSHALEYIVFVGRFMQTKYKATHAPGLLARAAARPWITYPLVFGVLGAAHVILRYRGWYVQPGQKPFMLAGLQLTYWFFYWEIYQSLVHFYFDGFLWKIRRPELRAYL